METFLAQYILFAVPVEIQAPTARSVRTHASSHEPLHRPKLLHEVDSIVAEARELDRRLACAVQIIEMQSYFFATHEPFCNFPLDVDLLHRLFLDATKQRSASELDAIGTSPT